MSKSLSHPLSTCVKEQNIISFVDEQQLFSAGSVNVHTTYTSICCMYASQGCNYVYTDRWIGLVLPAGVAACGCADPASSACATCRSRWTWLDGSSVGTPRFTGTEPGLGERCGRITESGSWSGAPNCNRTLRAVCKKGICFKLHFNSPSVY